MYIVSRLILVFCFWWVVGNGVYYWKHHKSGLGNHQALLIWMIALFLMAGLTRIVEMVDYLDSSYELPSIITSCLTSLIAIKIVINSRPFLKDIMSLPSVNEYNNVLNRLIEEKALKEEAIKDQQTLIDNLRHDVKNLTVIVETELWVHEQKTVAATLKTILERINK